MPRVLCVWEGDVELSHCTLASIAPSTGQITKIQECIGVISAQLNNYILEPFIQQAGPYCMWWLFTSRYMSYVTEAATESWSIMQLYVLVACLASMSYQYNTLAPILKWLKIKTSCCWWEMLASQAIVLGCITAFKISSIILLPNPTSLEGEELAIISYSFHKKQYFVRTIHSICLKCATAPHSHTGCNSFTVCKCEYFGHLSKVVLVFMHQYLVVCGLCLLVVHY